MLPQSFASSYLTVAVESHSSARCPNSPLADSSDTVACRDVLEAAGPAFIKWGQWAATRHDLFPPDFCAILEHLHTQVPRAASASALHWPEGGAVCSGSMERQLALPSAFTSL